VILLVEGTDVRVHTIGEKLFATATATAITTAATDYRYAHEQTGEEASFAATELSEAIADRCLALARGLAGIDLRITPDGRAVCFEVNANPGFFYYEDHTGQPMTAAVAAHLAGEN